MIANVLKNKYFCFQIVKNRIKLNNHLFLNGKN